MTIYVNYIYINIYAPLEDLYNLMSHWSFSLEYITKYIFFSVRTFKSKLLDVRELKEFIKKISERKDCKFIHSVDKKTVIIE